MQKNILQVIENSHLFAGLRQDLIVEIASSATRKTLAADEILFQKGDPADALWGVLSGRIIIEARTDDGKEMLLDHFVEGEVFGEVGVLDFGPRRVAARATQKSELFRFERTHFLHHLQTSPELCFRVFSLLCSHLRDTTENLEDTALYKLPNRLAKRLLMLAADSPADGGEVLHIVQSELAGMLGVNREAVNRHLRMFEKDGLIALRRQRIELCDQSALAALAAPGKIGDHSAWGTTDLPLQVHKAFKSSTLADDSSKQQDHRSSGLLAVDAAEYSRALMTDAAGTLQRLRAGFDAVNRAIRKCRGHSVWHTGDRLLAEFPDVQSTMEAALAIQQQVNPARRGGKKQQDSLFRIGVHQGKVQAGNNSFHGEAVNTVIGLTQLSSAGGIAMSTAARDALKNASQLELQFLGDHELKNVAGTVGVYSARTISLFKILQFRTMALVARRFRPLATATAALVLLAGIWFAAGWMGRQNTPLVVAHSSIVVLTFTASDNPALSYLARSFPNEVRAALSLIPGIRVIGQESSNYFDDRTDSVIEIGKKLQVAWLLRGSITGEDDEIEATAQLVNTVNDEVAWEQQFHAPQGDTAGISLDIVQHIAGSLGITISDSPDFPQLVPWTKNSAAQKLYVEAQSYLLVERQREAIKAVPLLQTVVELDPGFAEAHAVLSRVYQRMDLLDRQDAYDPQLRQELARQSLQKALSLKPNSPLVLATAALERTFVGDYTGGLALAERALRIDPNNTEALLTRYQVQTNQRDWVGALQSSERLISLDPLSIAAMIARKSMLEMSDRSQEALAVSNRALALFPERKIPFVHAWVAASKLKLGDRLGAIEASRKGMPYGYPLDLWTGLEYDWKFFDNIDPLRAAVGLVYVEEYDQIRQLLINFYGADEPDSAGASHGGYSNALDYLVNRGTLEALAGDFERSIDFFERARLLVPIEDGGLVTANIVYPVLEWSRQSHWSLALLFAYRKSTFHEKADIIAEQFEAMLTERIAALATVSELAEYAFLYRRAQYYAIESRTAEALDKLRLWVDNDTKIFTYIKWDPFMENLRGNPEFESIVAEVEARLAETRAQYHARQAQLATASGG